MYIALLKQYAQGVEFLAPQPAVSADCICKAEKALNVLFPEELKNLLSEMNGDNFLLLSIEQILEVNLRLRRDVDPECMDLKSFLFIATNGCGDYYGYKIEGKVVHSTGIYIWDHEEFKERRVASDIANLIELYYQDKI